MDQVYVVRHRVLVEKQSARRVAQEMGISRVTVKRYVEGAEPGVRKEAARAKPVTEEVRARVEESSKWTGSKQRLTAARLHRMLVEESSRSASGR